MSPEKLRAELANPSIKGGYTAVTMTHVDTSTGSQSPVEQYCQLLRGRNELVIVDGVVATGGVEERFDDWGFDFLVTGAQKCFGAPPGVGLLMVSERALARRKQLGKEVSSRSAREAAVGGERFGR